MSERPGDRRLGSLCGDVRYRIDHSPLARILWTLDLLTDMPESDSFCTRLTTTPSSGFCPSLTPLRFAAAKPDRTRSRICERSIAATPAMPMRFHAVLPGLPHRAQIIARINGIPFKKPGLYGFHVLVDNRELGVAHVVLAKRDS